MKKDNLIFLQHILECIDKIEEFTNKISEDEFMKSVQLMSLKMIYLN